MSNIVKCCKTVTEMLFEGWICTLHSAIWSYQQKCSIYVALWAFSYQCLVEAYSCIIGEDNALNGTDFVNGTREIPLTRHLNMLNGRSYAFSKSYLKRVYVHKH